MGIPITLKFILLKIRDMLQDSNSPGRQLHRDWDAVGLFSQKLKIHENTHIQLRPSLFMGFS